MVPHNTWSSSVRGRTSFRGDASNGTFYLIVGVDQRSTDSMGLVKATPSTPPTPNQPPSTPLPIPQSTPIPPVHQQGPKVLEIDCSKLTPVDVMTMSSGVTPDNLWLKWIADAARSYSCSNCIACAAARPIVLMIPHTQLITVIFLKTTRSLTIGHRHNILRYKCAVDFDLSKGSPTYTDAIGVPRGVPDEFKLADQIGAGFENLLGSLFTHHSQ